MFFIICSIYLRNTPCIYAATGPEHDSPRYDNPPWQPSNQYRRKRRIYGLGEHPEVGMGPPRKCGDIKVLKVDARQASQRRAYNRFQDTFRSGRCRRYPGARQPARPTPLRQGSIQASQPHRTSISSHQKFSPHCYPLRQACPE